MKAIQLTTPLDNTVLESLRCGDVVHISGVIYTARDAAHKNLVEMLKRNEKLPFTLENQLIYYAGPTPTKPGAVIGSCGPTTSGRMDAFTPALLNAGLKGMIGKGPRSQEVVRAMIKHEAVYFAAIGGAAALIADSVKECQIIAFDELGPEAIRRLHVVRYPCIVAIDTRGKNLYETGPLRYRITSDTQKTASGDKAAK